MKTQTKQKNAVDPVHVVLNDSGRVKAALELAQAVNRLAGVIAGSAATVHISDCTIMARHSAGIQIETER
jgi:hypothetical protein